MLKIYNLLGLMQRAGKLITGEDLITKNLKNKKIKLLVIAQDCGINTKKKLIEQRFMVLITSNFQILKI